MGRAPSRKKSPTAAQPKRTAYLSVTVNGATFEMTGSQDEVLRKFREFMDDIFRPIKTAVADAGKED